MRACMLAYSFYEEDSRIRRYAEALVKRGTRWMRSPWLTKDRPPSK